MSLSLAPRRGRCWLSDATNRREWLRRLNAAHERLGAAQRALELHAAKAQDMALTGQDTDEAYWQIYKERLRAIGACKEELEAIFRERLTLPGAT